MMLHLIFSSYAGSTFKNGIFIKIDNTKELPGFQVHSFIADTLNGNDNKTPHVQAKMRPSCCVHLAVITGLIERKMGKKSKRKLALPRNIRSSSGSSRMPTV
jgi:hypothetical protein